MTMDGRYIDIPGTVTHELPPLLVHTATGVGEDAEIANFESILPEAEDMIASVAAPEAEFEQRRFDLAVQLANQYKGLLAYWWWGDSVLEWVRQCEITFENEDALRKLLHPDVWPHASRASFVALLMEKGIATQGVALDRAVGMQCVPAAAAHRVRFQPVSVLSGPTIGQTAYATWSQLAPRTSALLPPSRFHFEVMSLGEVN